VHAFDVLGDPVRRRILELLSDGERTAGEIATTVAAEHGISQPAVSQHLKLLRDNGFATARAEGARRVYALEHPALERAQAWLHTLTHQWDQPLDALATEVARGRRERRRPS
jgi:DNA-binding transcriptional ArsR family regulator